jgi:hypothetical protein
MGKGPRSSGNGRDSRQPSGNSKRDPIAEINEVSDRELGHLDEAENPPLSPYDGPVDQNVLRKLAAVAKRAQVLADRRMRTHEEAIAGLKKLEGQLKANAAENQRNLEREHKRRLAELDERATRLTDQEQLLDERADLLFDREAKLAEDLKTLNERRTELLGREQAARSDFAEYRQQQILTLEQELNQRREGFDRQLSDRGAAQRADDEKARTEFRHRERELAEKIEQYERDTQELQRQQRRLAAREQRLSQDVADQVRDERARMDVELDTAREESQTWRERHAAVSAVAEQRRAELARFDAATLVLGTSMPEAAAELQELRRINAALRAESARRPLALEDRVPELEERCRQLTVDRDTLMRHNEELRRELAASRISVLERENTYVINNRLNAINKTLRQEIEQHTATLERTQAEARSRSPFPACTAMDDDPKNALEPKFERSGMPDLKDFVERVRALIAREKGLYYSSRDLRCFLGGLAASRLHLLEGISGTGKTLLPNVFAEIIGTTCETIAVASDWRTPQDLLGYYNPFERMFYESEFTQALYRAQLPLHKSKPFFIVLDEMNLAHPEHYFSSVLMALGNKDPRTKQLRLMTAPVANGPKLLRAGQDLAVPDNVWFIGTANRDETTVSFADKTYDRSHLLELPAKHVQFTPSQEERPFEPVSFAALMAKFEASKHNEEFNKDVEKVLTYFEQELGEILHEDLRVSWGNRLPEQAEAFVPVVRAAGGKLGEAADHLLTTKVLRRLRGNMDVVAPDINALRERVESTWRDHFPETEPTAARRVLSREIRQRGHAL